MMEFNAKHAKKSVVDYTSKSLHYVYVVEMERPNELGMNCFTGITKDVRDCQERHLRGNFPHTKRYGAKGIVVVRVCSNRYEAEAALAKMRLYITSRVNVMLQDSMPGYDESFYRDVERYSKYLPRIKKGASFSESIYYCRLLVMKERGESLPNEYEAKLVKHLK